MAWHQHEALKWDHDDQVCFEAKVDLQKSYRIWSTSSKWWEFLATLQKFRNCTFLHHCISNQGSFATMVQIVESSLPHLDSQAVEAILCAPDFFKEKDEKSTSSQWFVDRQHVFQFHTLKLLVFYAIYCSNLNGSNLEPLRGHKDQFLKDGTWIISKCMQTESRSAWSTLSSTKMFKNCNCRVRFFWFAFEQMATPILKQKLKLLASNPC